MRKHQNGITLIGWLVLLLMASFGVALKYVMNARTRSDWRVVAAGAAGRLGKLRHDAGKQQVLVAQLVALDHAALLDVGLDHQHHDKHCECEPRFHIACHARGSKSDEQQRDLYAIRTQADRISRVTKSMLALSRGAATVLKPMDLNCVLQACVEASKERAATKGVRIESPLAPRVPPAELRALSSNALAHGW